MDYQPVAHIKAVQTVLYVGTSWTEALVGSTRLSDRKWVEIFNRSAYKIYYSYDNTINAQAAFAIRAGGKAIFPLSDTVPLYLMTSQATGSSKVVVAEIS